MELTLPETWAVSVQAAFAGLLFLAGLVWAAGKAYARIMAEVKAVRHDLDAMKRHSAMNDRERAEIKREQADQKTTVAVMAEQIRNQSMSIDRIEDGVKELLKATRARP